jgi:hypothetical protein
MDPMTQIKPRSPLLAEATDRAISAALVLAALGLYVATLLPGVGAGDTAEFQRVLPTLGVAHPTGYPLYTILGWLWSWLPLGTPAWRISLFSAASAALAVGVVYLVAGAIGQARAIAAGAALALAASRTFWSQATIAEVYALAGLIQALLLLALLRWRAGRWPLWVAGLLLGLGLAHHRTIVLMLPGALLFVLLAARDLGSSLSTLRAGQGDNCGHDRPKKDILGGTTSLQTTVYEQGPSLTSEVSKAVLAALSGCLLYLYLPLRAPPWLDSWQTFVRHISGSDALSVWLTVDAPLRVAAEHLRELAARFVWPQFLPAGAILALLGLAGAWRRDRALAALLGLSYLLALLFCVLFFVQDVEVFMISAHLLAALLIGEGAKVLSGLWLIVGPRNKEIRKQGDKNMPSSPVSSSRGLLVSLSALGMALLALPALLLARNLPAIRAANTPLPELAARATLAQPLPRGALLLIDWDAVEPLRYLQEIEGLRRDVEVRPLNEDVARRDVDEALRAGRAAYLLHALPSLGLAQSPEGRLWRVRAEPIALHAETQAGQVWQDGIALTGYTLPRGPYRPGEIVPVTLAWQALARPQAGYTLFVHVVGAEGALWGQQDRPPAPIPTDQWAPGARVVDLYGPTLRLDTQPGRYMVMVGWYAYPSLDRLPLSGGQADSFVLGEIEVAPLR